MRCGANGQKAHEVLFSCMDEGADDEAAESGIGIGVSVEIAVGFFAVVCVFLFPLSTEFGGVHDNRGLFDRLCKRRNSLLARGCKRAFIRMLDYISMRAKYGVPTVIIVLSIVYLTYIYRVSIVYVT